MSGPGAPTAASRAAIVRAVRAAAVPALALALAVSATMGADRPLSAQEPEIGDESFRHEGPEPGWKGSADLGFTLTEGNSETTSLSVGGEVDYGRERQLWSFSASHIRATTDGEETANRGDAELTYDYFPTPRFFFYAKTSAAFNEPAGLDLRLAPGAGVGYRLVEEEALFVSAETGAEWSRDRFEDGTSDEAVRVSAGQSARWEISGTTNLAQSITYRPEAADLDDFLLDARVSLATRIVEGLGVKLTFRDQYDSEPFVDPDTGERRAQNDITFVTGLTYQF